MDIKYDDIAMHYDQLIFQDVKTKSFPYAGYQMIQEILTDEFQNRKGKIKVLDIGCGTLKLYEHINPNHMDLTAIDQSKNMIKMAKAKHPQSKYIEHDILKGLPSSLSNEKYDYIVINYLFMHFSFRTAMDIIHLVVNHLNPHGKILVGDLLFMNPQARQEFFYQHQDYVGLGVHFHLYSQFVNKMSEQLALSFIEVNDYTGLMIIENINDIPLHFEDPLVKYKANTEKWRSTHPQKKRE